MSTSLSLSNLTEPREKTYFGIVLAVSIVVWLLCLIAISPIIIIGCIAGFTWLANGLLVAQLKSDAVKVDADQFPALANTFVRVCSKLKVQNVPELYIVQSGGFLNAFATRHSGRNFVVLFSDLLDAYGAESSEIEFLLGHELGHIKSNHIIKRILLGPGHLLPLLGNAYSRACELSCDRHGIFAATDSQGAINAMLVLAGGKQAASLLSPAPFARQYASHRGFFVSWYELISGYPTLSQRVSNLIAISEGRALSRSRRNAFAYPFALFTFGGGTSGGANLLITVAVIGLLAAIAIPAFVKARDTAIRSACLGNLRLLNSAKEEITVEDKTLKDGDTIPPEAFSKVITGGLGAVSCSKGGVYNVNPVGEEPECSVHGPLSDVMQPALMPHQQM